MGVQRDRRPRKKRRPLTPTFSEPIKKLDPVGPEENPWFWNPGRAGVVSAPDWFMKKVRDVDPDGFVRIVWNPIRERWQVWARDYKVNHKICQGWKLLFVVEFDGEYVPLDNRTLAVLYQRSGRKWGNLHEYWLAVEQAMERDRELAARNRNDDVQHSAGDYWDYMKIKNIGSGSKFANHHSG